MPNITSLATNDKNVLSIHKHLPWPLTLRVCSSLWNLKRNASNLLYWFAAQQQTIILRHQKSRSIYSKFSVELSELTPSFQNPQEVA